ncbi:MAG: HD domain-containing phosphohydrolase, partial [Candidatus Omnitrophota bacterium]
SIIRHHHENYNGTGYPDGLKGEDIPLASRILSIADAFDALTSKRAYREAYPAKAAERIMKKDAGKKFDPALLEKFIDCLHRNGKG